MHYTRNLTAVLLILGLLCPPIFATQHLAPKSNLSVLPSHHGKAFTEIALAGLARMKMNLSYNSDAQMFALHAKADAITRDINKWLRSSDHNPKKLDEIQGDYNALGMQFVQYFYGTPRQQKIKQNLGLGKDEILAYLCLEFGLNTLIQSYAGGLGVLAGDTVRAASDRYPQGTFYAFGLAYQKGYMTQHFPHDWQEQRYPRVPYELYSQPAVDPITNEELIIKLPMPDGKFMYARVNKLMLGRTTVFMFDTDIAQNDGPDADSTFRRITDYLYDGDRRVRFIQEYLAGVGSVELMSRLGIKPGVLHLNEGHCALSIMARVKEEVETRMQQYVNSFEELASLKELHPRKYDKLLNELEDIESIRGFLRQRIAFTSHTPVPAGNETFDAALFTEFAEAYFGRYGLEHLVEKFLKYGTQGPSGETFNFSSLAIAFSWYLNGVARKNAEISDREYDKPLHWFREGGDPNGHFDWVTNGVHRPFWQAKAMQELIEKTLARLQRTGVIAPRHEPSGLNVEKTIPDLTKDELRVLINAIGDNELLETKKAMKKDGLRQLSLETKRKRILSAIEDLRDLGQLKIDEEDMEALRLLSLPKLLADERIKVLQEKGLLDPKKIKGVRLDPDALHIVVARRFATYKRSDYALSIAPAILMEKILESLRQYPDMSEWPQSLRLAVARVSSAYQSSSGRPERNQYIALPEWQARLQILLDADKEMNQQQGWLSLLKGLDPDGKFSAMKATIEHEAKWFLDMMTGWSDDRRGSFVGLLHAVKEAKADAKMTRLAIPKIQFIFAGKAHPRDDKGKAMIQRIVNSSLKEHVIFLEDYEMDASKELQKIADVWLNNPIPPEEASGTSGMKAGMNGALGVSTPDGWVLEALESTLFIDSLEDMYHVFAGQARIRIPDSEEGEGDLYQCVDPYQKSHPNSFYTFHSKEVPKVCPKDGLWAVRSNPTHPEGLMQMYEEDRFKAMRAKLMKKAIYETMADFDMDRFLEDYEGKAYKRLLANKPTRPEPDEGILKMLEYDRLGVQDKAFWDHRDRISLTALNGPQTAVVQKGQHFEVQAEMDCDGLDADSLLPIVWYGVRGGEERWREMKMKFTGKYSPTGKRIFAARIPTQQSGRYEYTFKVVPSEQHLQHLVEKNGHEAWMGNPRSNLQFEVHPLEIDLTTSDPVLLAL